MNPTFENISLAISLLDLTSLEKTDTPQKIHDLCSRAKKPFPARADIPAVAAVCIYPEFLPEAKPLLQNSSVHLAVVVDFPLGQAKLSEKIQEVKQAVEAGTQEIDIPINRKTFFAGNYQAIEEDLSQVKKACGKASLKVILESGELQSDEHVRKASQLAIAAGADFIKTSTGKIPQGASLTHVRTMCEVIREYYTQTQRKIGIKPSGGIRTTTDVLAYLELIQSILGKSWLTPALCRFGASSLLDDLLKHL